MLVSRANFDDCMLRLLRRERLALDTETTGLRAYHGDRLFSLIIASEVDVFYFNFYDGEDHLGQKVPEEYVLSRVHLSCFRELFADTKIVWYMHNAKFDLAMLAREGLRISGPVHCTKAQARVVFNDHDEYTLEACAARIGEKKDDAVEEYIQKHQLLAKEPVPGKKKAAVRKFFFKVPLSLLVPYAETDARVTYRLGRNQEETLRRVVSETPTNLCNVIAVGLNERALTKTVFEMERTGVLIDREFCERAAAQEQVRANHAAADFERLTGRAYKNSPKLFAEVFVSEKDRWVYTEKGNPSFESDYLETFEHPAAKAVLQARTAKSRADFFYGFLYHANGASRVHPSLNPDGAATGRFSSSEPNLQNIPKKREAKDAEFKVRGAIIPTPGFALASFDFDQMEYRMMMDYAGERELIESVLQGLDVHEATAQMMGIERDPAKTLNFLLLYGGGVAKQAMGLYGAQMTLSESLLKDIVRVHIYNKRADDPAALSQVSDEKLFHNLKLLRRAADLRAHYFEKLKNVQEFVRTVQDVAYQRGFIFNWLGRRCYYPDRSLTYAAPNHLIQGGCADVVKVGMNQVADFLRGRKSRMILQVHDELLVEVHESELSIIPEIRALLAGVYPSKYLPLTTGADLSWKSWADMEEFNGEKERDDVRGESGQGLGHAPQHLA